MNTGLMVAENTVAENMEGNVMNEMQDMVAVEEDGQEVIKGCEEEMNNYMLKLAVYQPKEGLNLMVDSITEMIEATAKEFSSKHNKLTILQVSPQEVTMKIEHKTEIKDVRRWLQGFSSRLYKKYEVSKANRRVFTVNSFEAVQAA